MSPSPGSLLVASRRLIDPNFRHTVVYLVEHSVEGTLGFVINRPLDVPLGELWTECPTPLASRALAAEGGPVERDKGLLLHRDAELPGSARMGQGLFIGGDLEHIARRWADGPDLFGPRLLLGHSGWAAGQLDRELAEGAWIVRPGSPELLFGCGDDEACEQLWQRLSAGERPNGGLPEPSLN